MKNINLKVGDILEVLKNKRTFTRAVWYIIISVIAVALITSLLVWYYSGSVLGRYQYDAVNNYQKSVLLAAENTNNQFPKAIMQIFSDADISRCLRDAISGTTPPNFLCISIWVEMIFDKISRPSLTTAAAVSSHEVSIPKINDKVSPP